MELAVWNANCSSTERASFLEWCEGLKVERHRSRPLFRIWGRRVVRRGLMEILVVWHVGEERGVGRIAIGICNFLRGARVVKCRLNWGALLSIVGDERYMICTCICAILFGLLERCYSQSGHRSRRKYTRLTHYHKYGGGEAKSKIELGASRYALVD